MKDAKSTKYLGHLVTSRGGVQDTVEDRRSKGKVATIKVILSEADLGNHSPGRADPEKGNPGEGLVRREGGRPREAGAGGPGTSLFLSFWAL